MELKQEPAAPALLSADRSPCALPPLLAVLAMLLMLLLRLPLRLGAVALLVGEWGGRNIWSVLVNPPPPLGGWPAEAQRPSDDEGRRR